LLGPWICQNMGVDEADFEAIASFKGLQNDWKNCE
jgi:hypothetical protein